MPVGGENRSKTQEIRCVNCYCLVCGTLYSIVPPVALIKCHVSFSDSPLSSLPHFGLQCVLPTERYVLTWISLRVHRRTVPLLRKTIIYFSKLWWQRHNLRSEAIPRRSAASHSNLRSPSDGPFIIGLLLRDTGEQSSLFRLFLLLIGVRLTARDR